MLNSKKIHPIIYCIEGLKLNEEEKNFFSTYRPAGVILFKRNVETKAQVIKLIEEVKQCTENPDMIVCTDQEGKSVSRFKPPVWTEFCDNIEIVNLKEKTDINNAKRLSYAKAFLLSSELSELSINVNLAPCIDIYYPNITNKVIHDRTFGGDPKTIIDLSKSFIYGMKENNILSTIKHLPGQGMVKEDSHLKTGINKASTSHLENFEFKILEELLPHSKFAMLAHVIYESIDDHLPATMSKKVIDMIKQKASYKGIIMTDAIEMTDMNIDVPSKSKMCLDAGCDIILVCEPCIKTAKNICKATGHINPILEKKIKITILENARQYQDYSKLAEKKILMQKEYDLLIQTNN